MEPVKIEPMPEPAPVSVYADLYAKHGHTMRTKPVADLLHSHPSHVRAMAQDGLIPAIRVGSRWVFPTKKIAEMLEGDGAYEG